MTDLIVNEIFGPTIQGEGLSKGKEVIFLRLSGCNLACSYCDTPYTWNWTGTKFLHPDKYDRRSESHRMSLEEVVAAIIKLGDSVKGLVISGGEPMLQMTSLEKVIQSLKELGWWVEIETNGTISPSDNFLEVVDQINCSPKLSSSGEDNPEVRRIKDKALITLASSSKVNFKFVVTSRQDMQEIVSLAARYNFQNIILMPEGRTKEEQLIRSEQVRLLAEEFGYSFSPRLHILQWNTKRGV